VLRRRTNVNRRNFLTALAGTPAVVALVAACGDPGVKRVTDPPGTQPAGSTGPTASTGATPVSGIAHPTGPADVVLRLGYEGGFVSPSTTFVRIPTLLITGAGQVFQPGAQIEIFPGPLLPAITTRTITEAGIQQILGLAHQAGLLATPADYTADTNVADAPDTVLDLNAAGGTFHHQAYALGMGAAVVEDPATGGTEVAVAGPTPGTANGTAPAEATPARQHFADFVAAVGDLDTLLGLALGPSAVLEARAYRLQATPVTLDSFAGSDPQPTVQPWPEGIGVRLATAATCAVVSGADVATVLQAANSQSLFTDAGVTYQLAAVAQLPGDADC
jgi:hypothetical protein